MQPPALIASVIGRDFTLAALHAVADVPEDAVAAGLDEAVRVGVLEEQVCVGGVQYRLRPCFFRQTFYEELRVARRIRLHQQVACVLEAQYSPSPAAAGEGGRGIGSRLADHAAELAEHFTHSSDPADLAKVVGYAQAVAERAVSVYAYSEAVRLLEQALDVQEVLDPDDNAKRCDLLLVLGEALIVVGEPLRVAMEVAEQAWGLASAAGDPERAGRAGILAVRALNRWGAPLRVGCQ